MYFYEDIVIGEPIVFGSHTFTAEEIKAFARRFDPQPFHLDEAAAQRSHFGKLCASGWHTMAVWMRMMVDYRQRKAAEIAAGGEPVPTLGPSPGFRDLRWLKPVYVGDTITYSSTVIDKRLSNSRAGWGLISVQTVGLNQGGETVVSVVSTAFAERRPA
ncbi:MAG: dehydratase [Rhizobiales bacterium]|nr:dehydratase [Hyphomicrobiales bacterium]